MIDPDLVVLGVLLAVLLLPALVVAAIRRRKQQPAPRLQPLSWRYRRRRNHRRWMRGRGL